MHCMYWPRLVLMPAQRPQKTPRWGGIPLAPLRAPLGRWPTTFFRHWGPTPGLVLAHPRAPHAFGGAGQCESQVPPIGPPCAVCIRQSCLKPHPSWSRGAVPRHWVSSCRSPLCKHPPDPVWKGSPHLSFELVLFYRWRSNEPIQ